MKTTLVAAAVAGCLLLPATQAQTVAPPTIGEKVMIAVCADRASAGGLTPNVGRPLLGQIVDLSFIVNNPCSTSAYKIPWRIMSGDTAVASGVADVAAGGNATVWARWTAAEGTFSFRGEVDPDHILGEQAMMTSVYANNVSQAVTFDVRADIEISSFNVTPSGGILAGSWQNTPYSNYRDGWITPPPTSQAVAVLRNRGAAPATNVSWSIKRDAYVHANGVIPSLRPGATQEVRDTYYVINPTFANVAWQVQAQGANETAGPENTRGFTQALTEAHIGWRMLAYTWTRDRYPDAFSLTTDLSGRGCRTEIWENPFDSSRYAAGALPYGHGFVNFRLDCRNALLTGGRATAEAFRNITLKNGWVVRYANASISVTRDPDSYPEHAGAGFAVKPGESTFTTSPFSQINLWADRGYSVNVQLNISISGPDHTNPWQ